MKAVIIAMAASAGFFCLFGCAEDGPTPVEVQDQLQRGVTGQGRLTPGTDRGDDTGVKPHAGESDTPR